MTTLRIRCRRLLEPDAATLRGEHLDVTTTLPAPGETIREAALPCSCGADCIVSLDFGREHPREP